MGRKRSCQAVSASTSMRSEGAISALTGLAGRIDTQRNLVVSGTPCSLPSLSAGTIGAVSSWLTDQEPELSTRLDLARLLCHRGRQRGDVHDRRGHPREHPGDARTRDRRAGQRHQLPTPSPRTSRPSTRSWADTQFDHEGHGGDVRGAAAGGHGPGSSRSWRPNAQYGGGGEVPMELAKTLRQGLATASDEPELSRPSSMGAKWSTGSSPRC